MKLESALLDSWLPTVATGSTACATLLLGPLGERLHETILGWEHTRDWEELLGRSPCFRLFQKEAERGLVQTLHFQLGLSRHEAHKTKKPTENSTGNWPKLSRRAVGLLG